MSVDTTLDVDLESLIAPYEEDNDPKRKTHIINPPGNLHIWRVGMDAREIVQIARMRGLPVKALCGYEWIPKHNPENYDVCHQCMATASRLMSERGE